MSTAAGILAGVGILVTAIILHELGHLVASKALGIAVDEFAVGFGRKLSSITRGGTEYSFRPIPAGGYIKPNQEAFKAAAGWKKIIVFIAGPAMNLLVAVVIFAGMGLAKGLGWQSFTLAFAFIPFLVDMTIQAIASMGVDAIGGPVAAVYTATKMSGLENMLVFTAIIHVCLGAMNLLPLPVLDGGQIVTTLCRIPRKSKAFKYVTIGTFALLMGAGVVLMGYDAYRIIFNKFGF